jgi:HAD superfamily hydrolase (TIGR01490 family)
MGSSPLWREFTRNFILVFMIKSIALFDIDNTMYEGFSYFELLEEQVNEDLIDKQVLDDAKASMQKYKSKLQDYETTIVELLDIYAAGLKEKSYDEVLESTKQFYWNSKKFFSYIKPTIEGLRNSHDIALVTGEPQFISEAVAELFGLESYYCTEYEVQAGKFTGGIKSYLASRHEKHDAIKHLMQGHGSKNSFAFGDSEGDIEMLRAVEHSICLNCTDGLRDIAEKEHWHMPKMQGVTELIKNLKAV